MNLRKDFIIFVLGTLKEEGGFIEAPLKHLPFYKGVARELGMELEIEPHYEEAFFRASLKKKDFAEVLLK